jgi:hypothetical protein
MKKYEFNLSEDWDMLIILTLTWPVMFPIGIGVWKQIEEEHLKVYKEFSKE